MLGQMKIPRVDLSILILFLFSVEELQEAENSSDGSDEPYSMDLEIDTDKLMQMFGEEWVP